MTSESRTAPVPAEALDRITDVIDEAHANLDTAPLAEVLLRVQALGRHLIAETEAAPGPARGALLAPDPSPEARPFLQPVQHELHAALDGPRAATGRALVAYAEEVAARPSGCALTPRAAG